MKKLLLIIGLVALTSISNATITNNVPIRTNQVVRVDLGQQRVAVIRAQSEIAVAQAELQATFYTISSLNVPVQNSQFKTNMIVKIPATVSALTDGGLIVAPQMPIASQIATLNLCIGNFTQPVPISTNQLVTLQSNLAALQAGLAAAKN